MGHAADQQLKNTSTFKPEAAEFFPNTSKETKTAGTAPTFSEKQVGETTNVKQERHEVVRTTTVRQDRQELVSTTIMRQELPGACQSNLPEVVNTTTVRQERMDVVEITTVRQE